MIAHIPYLLFVVWLAYRDSNNLTKIKHWLNALYHDPFIYVAGRGNIIVTYEDRF